MKIKTLLQSSTLCQWSWCWNIVMGLKVRGQFDNFVFVLPKVGYEGNKYVCGWGTCLSLYPWCVNTNAWLTLTPTSNKELTGLWSLILSKLWLRYSSCLTRDPLHKIRSHQAGARPFSLKTSKLMLEYSYFFYFSSSCGAIVCCTHQHDFATRPSTLNS